MQKLLGLDQRTLAFSGTLNDARLILAPSSAAGNVKR
jgi:hypothetical protein